VLAICSNLGGALFFASAATLFSDGAGTFVAPLEGAGAPGSAVGSDIFASWTVLLSCEDGQERQEPKELFAKEESLTKFLTVQVMVVVVRMLCYRRSPHHHVTDLTSAGGREDRCVGT
jgi:hypothetical protein